LVMVVISGVYAGRHDVRSGGGRLYVHIPAKLVGELEGRRVRVVAVVNAERCIDRRLHNSILQFRATLVEAGGTYRLNIPSYYARGMAGLANCATLDVWLTPMARQPR
jgi:hypothetical protein